MGQPAHEHGDSAVLALCHRDVVQRGCRGRSRVTDHQTRLGTGSANRLKEAAAERIIIAAMGWGLAIAFAGISKSLILVLFCLMAAGAFDMISGLFRGNIWNQTIPDNLRGRLAGIELLSYSVGPLAGQLRAASMAAATSLSFSVTSGGLICCFAVGILAIFLPKFRKYDVQTNEFAVREQKLRKNRTDDENIG